VLSANLYETSPRSHPMILARSEEPTSKQKKCWNEHTEENLRQFMKQRAAKRMQEIGKETDQIKPYVFYQSKAQKQS